MGGTYRSVKLPVRKPPTTGHGTAKNQLSAIDFGHRRPIEEEIDRRRPIEEEIDRWRSIEGEKGKKKKKKKRKRRKKKRRRRTYFPRDVLAHTTSPPVGRPHDAARGSPPTGHPRAVAALARGCFFSHTRRRNISPRGEKD
ncbi:hypothetical protein GW17_00023925 [Ensete ventricosum]|nr:hypothetical protein GW17_00023925 [Ensete ventricosum]